MVEALVVRFKIIEVIEERSLNIEDYGQLQLHVKELPEVLLKPQILHMLSGC